MNDTFEISRTIVIDATPADVWEAVTNGSAGWLWPMETENRLGGQAAFGGTVTAWDPPHHFTTRVEGPDGWFNELDDLIAVRDGVTALQYTHRGVFADNWDQQFDGADKHTDFYLFTLKQYLETFTGKQAAYVSADAPPASDSADAIDLLLEALGGGAESVVGDAVRLPVAAAGDVRGEIDYLTADFVGIRTPDALYRFFGRHTWGGPVSLSVHAFGEGVDTDAAAAAWVEWFTVLYAGAAAGPS